MSINTAAELEALRVEFAKMSSRLAHFEQRAEYEPTDQYQQRHNQACIDESRATPLDKDEILDTVFSFIGTDDYFYTAAVCSNWRRRFLKLCYSEADKRSKANYLRGTIIRIAEAVPVESKCTTSYRSAIMTTARLQLALRDTLTVEQLQASTLAFAEDIVCHSLDSVGVLSLTKLHELGWDSALCEAAAYYGKFQLLQWLHERDCHQHSAIGKGQHMKQ
jgi:hypothetical protein